ncbi:hypothetical protein GCM10023349_43300 [Nocardioides conyzicola]|uniref:Ig-like domain-containing protein n=1 Tax=Nocardioides conyzicola TaxID=1651781 RepID=A0ABP8XZS1_9ACTN
MCSTLVTLLVGVFAVGVAEADVPAPVVVNDSITMWPGSTDMIDVLANDTDPAGGDLAFCRLPKLASPGPIHVADASMFSSEIEPGDLQVSADAGARGTYEVDYYVCNHDHLTPATLTVDIRPVEPVDVVAAPRRPGWLRVDNHNSRRVFVLILDRGGCRMDGHGYVPAHGSRLLRARHHRITWIAGIGAGDDGGVADQGRLNRVPLDGPPAPKSPPGHFCQYYFGRAVAGQPAG